MTTSDRDDRGAERMMSELRQLLRHDAELPPGIVARLQAGAARARRSGDRFTAAERTMLGTFAFTALAYRGGLAGVVAGLVVAVIYAAMVNTLARPVDSSAQH